jgi:hypothetical protein
MCVQEYMGHSDSVNSGHKNSRDDYDSMDAIR